MQNAYDFFRFITLAIPTGFAYFSEIPSTAAAAGGENSANPVRPALHWKLKGHQIEHDLKSIQ
jgi:hypothetical protein